MSIKIDSKVKLPTGEIGYVYSIIDDKKINGGIAFVKTADDSIHKILVDDLVIVEDTEKTITRDDFRKVSIDYMTTNADVSPYVLAVICSDLEQALFGAE